MTKESNGGVAIRIRDIHLNKLSHLFFSGVGAQRHCATKAAIGACAHYLRLQTIGNDKRELHRRIPKSYPEGIR
jgi:hypothetical protein